MAKKSTKKSGKTAGKKSARAKSAKKKTAKKTAVKASVKATNQTAQETATIAAKTGDNLKKIKKAVPKMAIAKKIVKPKRKSAKKKKVISDAQPHEYFILCDGRPIKNLKQLALMLDELEDHIFQHHVTGDRHDFSRWVEDVFKEVKLAKNLSQSKDKKENQVIIFKHIIQKL